MSEEEQPNKEIVLRRKEKELQKREDVIRESAADLAKQRSAFDVLRQELEAREVVMNDAEAKHGSLLQREEDVTRREAMITETERCTKSRLEDLSRKETELDEMVRVKQKEYEDKLFPLAAREQEIQRRETEVQAMETELESKMRAFAKKMQLEEERDRAKEKQLKDQEIKVRDQQAAAERRQAEADAAFQQVQDKMNKLKGDSVELEARDRDFKWRDEQLRIGLQEVQEVKGRLMQWEKAISLREEELNTANIELGAKRSELEMRELQLSERLTKVVNTENELSHLETSTTTKLQHAEFVEFSASQRLAVVAEKEADIQKKQQEIDDKKNQIAATAKQLAQREQEMEANTKALEERERSLKDWMIEMEFREAQLKKHEEVGQRKGGATPPPGSMQGKFNSALVDLSLRQVQDLYLAKTARSQAAQTAKNEKDRKTADLSEFQSQHDDNVAESAVIRETESQVSQLEQRFSSWSARYYAVPGDRIDAIFTEHEREQLQIMFDFEERAKEEHEFLSDILGEFSKSKAPFGVSFTAAEWLHFYTSHVVKRALQRKRSVLAARLSKLNFWCTSLEAKDAKHPGVFPAPRQQQPIEGSRIHRRALKQYTVSTLRFRDKSPVEPDRPAPPLPSESPRQSAPQSFRRGSEGAPKTPKSKPPKDPEMAKAVELLPAYLRKYYDES